MSSKGIRYLFKSKQFHYQALRTLGHSIYHGAAPGEVLSVINHIKDGDVQNWHDQWIDMGKKSVNQAESSNDNLFKGNAFLRASNYFRTSEFFMDINDQNRLAVYNESVDTFQKALKYLSIKHKIYYVPYENGKMRNYYFPGDKEKPLIFICGGFDSTNEESFFWMGSALIQRGYPVIMFEGPGQSSMLREYQIKFISDWHLIVSKIIDASIMQDNALAKKKKVLLGISYGGLLAGRAAPFENRIDAIALFGGPFDTVEAGLFQAPVIARWLYEHNYKKAFNVLSEIKQFFDPGLRWGVKNGLWTIGGQNAFDFLKIATDFTQKNIHEKVKCHVLNFYGEKDIYVVDGFQDVMFEKAFPNAASYTLKIFKEEEGSAEHCQIGSGEQAVQLFVTWLNNCNLEDKK